MVLDFALLRAGCSALVNMEAFKEFHQRFPVLFSLFEANELANSPSSDVQGMCHFPNRLRGLPSSGQTLSCVHSVLHHDGDKELTDYTGRSPQSTKPGRISATVGTGTLPISLF